MKLTRIVPASAGIAVSVVLAGMTLGQEGAKEPGRLGVQSSAGVSAATHNQRTAEAIAARLRGAVPLKQHRVDITFAGGVAELTGQVADAFMRDQVLREAQGVPGVERVSDRLTLARGAGLVAVQAANPPPLPVPPFGLGQNGAAAFQPGGPQEPLPIFQAPPGPNPAQQPPPMPPYAWPSFAPYNNYSRVAYPETYPHSAWPFIGPMYPYPKVPLGWRKVSLEWQDGSWWYSKGPTGHDWWRIRYW